MDNLSYHYKANTNQLHKVTDAAADAAPGDYSKYNDLKQGQANNNYQYDEIGNLVSDASESLTNITWTVYGKIASITKGGAVIRYVYDASGNRIFKYTSTDTTAYVRDASGNVLSVYTRTTSTSLQQTEIHLYGSARLGIKTAQTVPDSVITLSAGFIADGKRIFTRAEKIFELSNHLGNVLVTLSDRRVQHSAGGTTVDYYRADVASANDYYPFGMMMPGRKYSSSASYRYSINGQEKETELNQHLTSAEFWMYDSRIARRWNVDPVVKEYESSYSTFASNPILFIDPKGDTEFDTYDSYKKNLGDKAMSEKEWNGSDGHWLKSDRTGKNSRWSNAMESITKTEDVSKLSYIGSDKNDMNYPFKIVRDYYIWAQHQVDSKGWQSRWAMGASYLVDELADSYQAEGGKKIEAMMGNLFAPDLGQGMLKELNLGIVGLALHRYNGILYGNDMSFANTEKDWYEWDKQFVTKEQSGVNSPAYAVYLKYNGSPQLSKFNSLSRQDGIFSLAVTKHFFPSFALYNGDLTKKSTEWDVDLRVNLPLLMIWPLTHPFYQKDLGSRFKDPIAAGHASAAASAIEKWHKFGMKY